MWRPSNGRPATSDQRPATRSLWRCSGTLPPRRCSSTHEGAIPHTDESTTPFPCVRVAQSTMHGMLERNRSRYSECKGTCTWGPALYAPLRPCCGWLPRCPMLHYTGAAAENTRHPLPQKRSAHAPKHSNIMLAHSEGGSSGDARRGPCPPKYAPSP